jgi:predicted PurR-regulated permease PerM
MNGVRNSQIVFFFALAVGLYLAWILRDTLLLVYVSALLAIVFTPAAEWVSRRHIGKWHPGRGLSVVLLLVAVLAAITLFFAFALPPIVHDVRSLVAEWPQRVESMKGRLARLPVNLTKVTEQLEVYRDWLIGNAGAIFGGITSAVSSLFMLVLLTLYFMIDGDRTFQWAMSMVDPQQRPRLTATLVRAKRRMQKWIVGQLALMLIFGSLSFIVFWALGVRYYYALGVFAGLANFVPIVGPLAAVILASLVAATDSFTKLVGVVVFFILYQQLENAYLTPRIMRSTVELPTVAVIVALLVGGALGGILGALVAVPSAALLAVLIDEYLVHKESVAES